MFARILRAAAGVGLAIVLVPPPVASAHEERGVADHEVVVGWRDEPAYAGMPNAVEVTVTRGGEPVKGARLEAVVAYGRGLAGPRSGPLRLAPERGEPGSYLAPVTPVEPGIYTFRISGSLGGGERMDETFVAGPQTFERVERADGPTPEPGPREVTVPPASPIPALDRSGPPPDVRAGAADGTGLGRGMVAGLLAVLLGTVLLVVARRGRG